MGDRAPWLESQACGAPIDGAKNNQSLTNTE